MTNLTSVQITEARNWLADCVWADMDADDFAELTDAQILRGVERHYDGGVNAFLLD